LACLPLSLERRVMGLPQAFYTPAGLQWRDYIRDLPSAKWGSGVSLRSSNLEPPMSALGQKQTSQGIS
jgi:hypothetical protein